MILFYLLGRVKARSNKMQTAVFSAVGRCVPTEIEKFLFVNAGLFWKIQQPESSLNEPNGLNKFHYLRDLYRERPQTCLSQWHLPLQIAVLQENEYWASMSGSLCTLWSITARRTLMRTRKRLEKAASSLGQMFLNQQITAVPGPLRSSTLHL